MSAVRAVVVVADEATDITELDDDDVCDVNAFIKGVFEAELAITC